MNEILIQLRDVSKRFGANQVLDGVNLDIHRGEVTTIIGKSGVGKSVLLKHMIGLLEPDTGQVLFEGRPLTAMKRQERKALKSKFSYVFQGTALFDSMTVGENIALPLRERGSTPEAAIADRVRQKLEQLDLQGLDDKYPSQLSGGMQKRVALARALVTDPEIVLFDEPTTGLDPIRKNAVHSMISDYQKKFGFTGVIVSHDIPDVFYISQQVAFINQGRIIFQGSPKNIQEISDPEIQQFIRTQESACEHMPGLAPYSLGEKRYMEEMARLNRHLVDFSVGVLIIENLDELGTKAEFRSFHTVFTQYAAYVQETINITDYVARYGLYESLLLLSHTNLEQAGMFSARLGRELRERTDQIMDQRPEPDISFAISLGVVEAYPGAELTDLLAEAESRREVLYEYRV